MALPTLFLPKRSFDRNIQESNRMRRYAKKQVGNDSKGKEDVASFGGDHEQDHKEDYEMKTVEIVPEGESSNLINFSRKKSIVKNHSIKNQEENNATKSVAIQTIISLKRSQLVSHEFLTDTQLKHFTGCTKKLFNFLTTTFGSSHSNTKKSALSMENELLVMLMKLRLNLYYSTLANLFDVSIRTIKRIFINWTCHLYKCFSKINFWSLSSTSENQYKIILDCTEFRIERSRNPIVQQATYSTYYGTNTFKVLVACSENAEITFVSDVYGGSISDRKIIEVTNFIQNLKEGDFVLADRGFDISDLLEEKGVRLNIPPFKKGPQLTEEEILKTRVIANRRIVVENVIGLAKKHKILRDRIPVTLWPCINEIVYNCFMICNLKESIVRNKSEQLS